MEYGCSQRPFVGIVCASIHILIMLFLFWIYDVRFNFEYRNWLLQAVLFGHSYFICFNLKVRVIVFAFVNIQIKSFIILAVIHPSVQKVCGAYIRVTAPGQHSSFRRNVVAVASLWQHCVRFDRAKLKPQTSHSRDERVTVRPTGQIFCQYCYPLRIFLWGCNFP